MPPGSIKLRSGSVCCNANSCSPTILPAVMRWSRLSRTLFTTTTRLPSLSNGPTRLRSWNASLARTCGRLYLGDEELGNGGEQLLQLKWLGDEAVRSCRRAFADRSIHQPCTNERVVGASFKTSGAALRRRT